MIKNLNIYRLLDIKPDSIGLWILLLPPIYSLWLLAIGKKLLGKQRKSDRLFSTIILLFFVLNIFIIIALPIVGVDVYKDHRPEFLLFGLIYFSVFFISLLLLTNITVEFERSQNSDRYYSIIDFRDYLWRFFALFYWPIFIWSYQKIVNDYNKDIMPSH